MLLTPYRHTVNIASRWSLCTFGRQSRPSSCWPELPADSGLPPTHRGARIVDTGAHQCPKYWWPLHGASADRRQLVGARFLVEEVKWKRPVSAVLRQHGWRIEMHPVGSSGDDRHTVILSSLSLRIRASASNIDHKPHYRPGISRYPEHVQRRQRSRFYLLYQRGARWFLG